MKGLFLLLGLFLCLTVANAQLLKGRITDIQGEPVMGATLYVREIAQGSVADENGEFQLNLQPGEYTCEVSSLGYEKQVRKVSVAKQPVVLDFQLNPTVYMLKEVKVTNKGEDPAYYIMRKAIAKAPFFRNQIKSYRSEVYTKGTMKLDKLPRLLTLGAENQKKIKPMIGKLFLLESVMSVKFTAPDHYEQNIVAFSSTIPLDMSPADALDIIVASIYDPMIIGMVSPLAPGAFSYYRFRFQECYNEGGRIINKIRVEPRKQSGKLFDGYIYIAEEEWCVMSFNLKAQIMGITADIKGIYHEVKPAVFMPTSYDIAVNVKTFGIKAGGKYYSSVKYLDVNAVASSGSVIPVKADAVRTAEKTSPKSQKITKQIEALSKKEELSTREAYRLANLAQQAIEAEKKDTLPPLQIRSYGVNNKITVDSLAARKDSLYWLAVRTVPLKLDEVVSYRIKDSVRSIVDGNGSDTLRRGKGDFAGKILLGGNFSFGKKVSIGIDGLIWAVPEYNFVDGFWIGQGFDIKVRFCEKVDLKVRPEFYFATARKTLIWSAGVQLQYAPMHRGMLKVNFGDVSEDYKMTNGAWRLENTLRSLVYADNFMKFYGRRYFNFSNSIDIANGLTLQIEGNYEKRKVLGNHISYNFFKRDPKTNSPVEEGGVDMPDNTSLSFALQAGYTPRLYYRVREGKKYYEHSDFPTFLVRYEKGVPTDAEYTSSFDRFDIAVMQSVNLGVFDHFSYVVSAGKFLSKKELYFPDYKHFSTTGWVFSKDQFAAGFFIKDYYRLSTNDEWLQIGLNYTSSYLLFKRLPFLQRFLFDEAIHARYLWMPALKHYTEWGYSIGLGNLGRAGVFIGFERDKYEGIGVRLSIPLNVR